MVLSAIPLAWRNMTADKRRLMLSTCGVMFAVVLMLSQIGFRNALLDSSVEIIRHLDGDVFLLSSTKYRLFTMDSFPRRRLFQALACEGVATARPLYVEIEAANWKNPDDRTLQSLRVLAFDPDQPVFLLPEVNARLQDLKRLDTVLFDWKSRDFLGHPQEGTRTELAGRAIQIVGLFRLGADFAIDGNLITGDTTFFDLFPDRRSHQPHLERVEVGILKLKPGADRGQVIDYLRGTLAEDVVVLSKSEFAAAEWNYWLKASPVGFVFTLGTAVGFLVGIVICYQILFTELTDRLPQFATLKAIGYSNGFLLRVVLMQAFYLALIGFVPAVTITYVLYFVITGLTGLLMQLTWALLAKMLLATIIMCLISGMFAVRKVLSADPADMF